MLMNSWLLCCSRARGNSSTSSFPYRRSLCGIYVIWAWSFTRLPCTRTKSSRLVKLAWPCVWWASVSSQLSFSTHLADSCLVGPAQPQAETPLIWVAQRWSLPGELDRVRTAEDAQILPRGVFITRWLLALVTWDTWQLFVWTDY